MKHASLLQIIESWMTGSLHFAEPVATALSTVLVILLAGAFTITAIHINHFIFYRVLRMKAVHQKFMYSLINCAFIITGLMLLGKFVGVSGSLERVLLGSTGLFVAIIGFAAQSVIGDIVAGFMLSVCRPFALGDRVVLQNAGITGTVRDMTIRHTVIHCFDGLYVVVPNSVMNSEILHNNSYQNSLTGSYLEFCIGYDSDIPTAMKIIHDAVIACKYTVEYAGDNPEGRRAAVYITEFADSCVKLRTTVWARNSDENFMACSDIMLRVKNNFNIYGVEIPYNYVNVVNREYVENKDVRTLSTKNIYSDNVVEVRKSVQSFCDAYNIKDRDEQQLTLLAEELFNVMGQYTKKESYFNILMNRNTCEMHLRILSDVNYEDKKSLYALSTMDTPWVGIPDIIRNLIGSYKSGGIENNKWSLSKYKADVAQGDVSQKDIGKSILTALSDDIQVTAKNGMIEIVIYKKVR